MKKPDILENQVNKVYLGLGSNLGNKENNLNKAMFLLSDMNTTIVNVSSLYLTKSWPNELFPDYINIVLKIKTNLDPKSLFVKIKKVEKSLGRKNKPKNHPRECDIDILDFNRKKINIMINEQKLILPHPRMSTRSFVLLPLFEISKNWKHPVSHKKITILLNKISDNDLSSIKLI